MPRRKAQPPSSDSTSAPSTPSTPKPRKKIDLYKGLYTAPPPPPVPREFNPNPLLPSFPAGIVVDPDLFLTSSPWLEPLRRDVDELLVQFEKVWPQVVAGGHGLSPFEVFKSVWDVKGWAKVGLIGLIGEESRVKWSGAVARAFLERLTGSASSLHKLAALFALYIFWTTQPSNAHHFHIQVDPATLDYIISLPTTLAPSLASQPPTHSQLSSSAAPSGTATPTPTDDPSLDILAVVHSLLSNRAFVLVPPPLYNHPRNLPTTHIADASAPVRAAAARLAFAAEHEMRATATGRHSTDQESDDTDMNGLNAETSWSSTIDRSRDSYLALKRRFLPTLDGGIHGSTAADERERALVQVATAKTLEATAARRIIQGVVGSGAQAEEADLLGLVGDAERGKEVADALSSLSAVAEQQVG